MYANVAQMNLPWLPSQPIETLSKQLRDAQQFAKNAGELIQDSEIVRSDYSNIVKNILLTQMCYEWRKITWVI